MKLVTAKRGVHYVELELHEDRLSQPRLHSTGNVNVIAMVVKFSSIRKAVRNKSSVVLGYFLDVRPKQANKMFLAFSPSGCQIGRCYFSAVTFNKILKAAGVKK